MKRAADSRGWRNRSQGFSLIEMMTATMIFLIISAAAFTLLVSSQKHYQTDSQMLNSFQEARLGLDQIVRDVNGSGYPPVNQFTFNPGSHPVSQYVTSPFAWPNYLTNPACQIGICTTPSDFDLIIEMQITNQNCANRGVAWIRYRLVGTTLFRGVVCKTNSGSADPDGGTLGSLVPFVQNVMNNAPAAQIAQYQAAYPAMFPGGNPVPIFSYLCDTSTGPQRCASAASSDNSPANIRAVGVTLILAAPAPDAQTGRPLLVELNGAGKRMNPRQ
jgi:prepilin-type N-terminal cleavage/methylation domain-containing protein